MFRLCLAPGMLLDDCQTALGRVVVERLILFRGYRQGMGVVLGVVVGVGVHVNVNVVKR